MFLPSAYLLLAVRCRSARSVGCMPFQGARSVPTLSYGAPVNSTLRTASGVFAVLAGLISVAACGSSSPVAVTSTGIASTSSAAPTTSTSAPSVMSITVPSSGRSIQSSAPGTVNAPPVASTSAATPGTSATNSAQREVNPAGDIPDNQAFVPYTPSSGKFTVTVPEGWARTDTAAGVLFTDKYNSIRVETRTATRPPTTASIRSSEVPTLSGSAPNFQLGDITTVSRKAGTAVLLTYHADTPPNAVTGKVTTAAFERYVFFKAGTEVLITVGAPVGGDNVDPWRTVTDSFSWPA